MQAIVKFAVLALAGVVLILAAVAAYIAATFDPNRYKPQIVQAVKDRTQRDLRLEGDIKLAFFPGIRATLGRVSLSERGNDKEFAGVDDVRVALKLVPLLSKQVVVETVEVKNLRAHLVRFKDGATNIDDLISVIPKPAARDGELPLVIDIDRVTLENAALTYTDEAAGATYALSKLNLRTGRIASGVPVKIDLASTVQSDQPAMNLETVLKATVAFDLEQRSYGLAEIDFGAKGMAAGFENLVMTAKGDVDAKLASSEFLISRLKIAATGKPESGNLDVKLDVPTLTVTNGNVSGERLVLDATLSTVKGKLVAKLEIPGIGGNAKAFKAGAVTASININNPGLLKNPLAATLNASAQVDLARQNASLVFAAKFDDSAVKGTVGLTKFTPPFYTFDITIDQLDADRYLPQPDPKQPFDLAALKGLKASGSVKIDVLTVSNVKTTNVRIEIKPDDGRQPSPKIISKGRPG